jgi:hypothetical protein
MNGLRQVFLGILAALLSGSIVLGGLALSFVEGGTPVAQAPASPTLAITLPPPATPAPGEPTFTASPTLPPATATIHPTSAACPPRVGWVSVAIPPDMTLGTLAQIYNIAPQELAEANCTVAVSSMFAPGTFVNLPGPLPEATATPIPPTATATPPPPPPTKTIVACGAPAGWVAYIVQPGDSLFRISVLVGASVAQLQSANCLGNSTIRVGQALYVPFLPSTPTRFIQPTNPPTLAPPPSKTPVPPSNTVPPPTATQPPTQPPPPTPTRAPTLPPPPTDTQPPPPTPTSAPTATQPPPTNTPAPPPDTPTPVEPTAVPSQAPPTIGPSDSTPPGPSP